MGRPETTDRLRREFVKVLDDAKTGLTPANAARLNDALLTLDEHDASRSAKLRAWWELALTHLRCHKLMALKNEKMKK